MRDQDKPENLEHVARNLFLAVAPERVDDLVNMWETYQPHFNVLPDCHPDGPLIMDAGAFRYVRFNNRIMRAFWLASFAAWEGYVAVHLASQDDSEIGLDKLRNILDCIAQVCSTDAPELVPFPPGIPPLGELVPVTADAAARVAGEIAVFVAGWGFLHEVRHLMHQQQGTSTSNSTEAEDRRSEELSCDDFATRFILERSAEYARAHGVPERQLALKRQLAIYFALFALTIICRGSWGDSKSHPAMQRRIDRALKLMEELDFSKSAAVIASSAFYALAHVCPDAPSPMTQINERARTENWTVENILA